MTTTSDMVANIIGFVMSGVFIIFICTRLFLFWLRRFRSQPISDLDAIIDDDDVNHMQQQLHHCGLEPVLVAEIPTTEFCRDIFSVEDAQCSICLGEYQEKEVLRIMPKCGHNYHLYCIDIWLAKHTTCPVCRLTLREATNRTIVEDVSQGSGSNEPNHVELAPTSPQGSASTSRLD